MWRLRSRGRQGVVRIYPDKRADLFLSGPGIVGLAFTPSRALVVATTNAIYRVDAGIKGRPLLLSPMNAEIIAVGSELLTPQRVDTNSLYLTGELNNLGVEVVTKCVIGDDRERLADAVRRAISRSEIVILSGGLGPTEDDVTREAVAEALDRKLVFHPEIAEALEQRFAQYKRKMAEINKRQAFVIEGADVLPNDRGTAPGQWIEESGAVAMLLPGPPHELKAMFERQCLPRLDADRAQAGHPHAACCAWPAWANRISIS